MLSCYIPVMSLRNDQAIVLRLYDYSESSQIAALLTRESGLIRVMAKGAKRSTKTKVSVGLDLLEFGDLSYAPPRGGAGLATLAEWLQRDTFAALRRDLAALYCGIFAAELVTLVMEEGDPHGQTFDALLAMLQELSGGAAPTVATDRPMPITAGSGSRSAAGLVRFQAELLKSIGFAPVLRECVDCGKPRVRGARAWFSSRAGGMLCEDCHGRHREKRPLAAVLLDSARGTTRPADWVELLSYHLLMIGGREIRSAAALFSVLGIEPRGPFAPHSAGGI